MLASVAAVVVVVVVVLVGMRALGALFGAGLGSDDESRRD